MDVEEFRRQGYAAIDRICDYYSSLDKRPVRASVEPGYLIEQLPRKSVRLSQLEKLMLDAASAPQTGEPFDRIANDFQSLILPGITHWQHAKWFAYFPSISSFESILGELMSASVSNPGFNWVCSPACTELEQVTMDWSARLFGLSPEFHLSQGRGGGIILNSASEAALTAAIAAREKALLVLTRASDASVDEATTDGVSPAIREKYTSKLVMYGSTQTHSLATKAARLLGVHWRPCSVSSSDDYGLRGAELRRAMQEDQTAGLVPFFAIATVGTTNSGAVDFVAEIGEVVREFPTAFLHVDAAWAGVATALPEEHVYLRLPEINQFADSFCTNMHKWGLVGFDCSLLFVRQREILTSAMDVTPFYLRSKEGDSGTVIDYRNWQLALGRRFRSVKLWFVLRSFGVEGFQSHLRQGIELCQRLSELIRSSDIFELVTPPSLSLLTFRLNPKRAKQSAVADAELNLLNQKLHDQLNLIPEVFLTPTMLHSKEREVYCLRFAIGSQRTTWQDVLDVWNIIDAKGRELE